MRRTVMRRVGLALVAAAFAAVLAVPAHGQVPGIRLARQYSMGYLQFNTMAHEKLIEKHARALVSPT
jgi:NitT/TauT family transport system substrate-binding protein